MTDDHPSGEPLDATPDPLAEAPQRMELAPNSQQLRVTRITPEHYMGLSEADQLAVDAFLAILELETIQVVAIQVEIVAPEGPTWT